MTESVAIEKKANLNTQLGKTYGDESAKDARQLALVASELMALSDAPIEVPRLSKVQQSGRRSSRRGLSSDEAAIVERYEGAFRTALSGDANAQARLAVRATTEFQWRAGGLKRVSIRAAARRLGINEATLRRHANLGFTKLAIALKCNGCTE